MDKNLSRMDKNQFLTKKSKIKMIKRKKTHK